MSKYSRIEKGLEIAKSGRVREVKDKIVEYEVFGDSDMVYMVQHNLVTHEWICQCPDYEYNGIERCKHIHACKFYEEEKSYAIKKPGCKK